MDLKAWREKRKGEQATLPSGLVVTLRRCDLLDLAEQGGIPAPLVAVANQLIEDGASIKVEELEKFMPTINLVAKANLVDPKVADTPDSTHVGIEELPVKDRLAIFNWAAAGVARLVPFREKPGQPADALGDVQGLPGEAEQPAGD